MAGWKAAVLKGKVILDCFWDLLMIGGDAWNIFFMSIYVGISTHVWFFPHLFGKTHFYTESSYVAFTTLVCFIAHMCGNNQICVRKPHREVLGFFHTCLVKHTHVLISPWNHGDSPIKTKKILLEKNKSSAMENCKKRLFFAKTPSPRHFSRIRPCESSRPKDSELWYFLCVRPF